MGVIRYFLYNFQLEMRAIKDWVGAYGDLIAVREFHEYFPHDMAICARKWPSKHKRWALDNGYQFPDSDIFAAKVGHIAALSKEKYISMKAVVAGFEHGKSDVVCKNGMYTTNVLVGVRRSLGLS